MPLSDRFWIATADTLLFENVRYVAHCSEVQHSLPIQCCSSTPVFDREGHPEGRAESHHVSVQLLEVDVHLPSRRDNGETVMNGLVMLLE